MLRLAHVEEIAAHLLELPALVRAQEARAPDFVGRAERWLTSLEAALAASRLPQAGNVAMLRGAMIAAGRGEVPEQVQLHGRVTRTRLVTAAARQALQRAATLATELLAQHQARLAEAERVARQVIAAGRARELVPVRGGRSTNTEYLLLLRARLSADGELAAGVLHLEGLTGAHDALVLLDRALSDAVMPV